MKTKLRKVIIITILVISIIVLLAATGCRAGIKEVEEVISADTVEEIEEIRNMEEAAVEEIEPSEEAPEEEADATAQIIEISPEEVFEIMEKGEDYLIVDVRTEEEYGEGHLEGALLLPVQELEDRLGELPADKPIIVYCRSGSRSRNAAEILIASGFTMVYDMGGISDWISKDYPVILEE